MSLTIFLMKIYNETEESMTYTKIFFLIEDSGKEVAWEILEAEKNPIVRSQNRKHYFRALHELKEEVNFPLNKEWTE